MRTGSVLAANSLVNLARLTFRASANQVSRSTMRSNISGLGISKHIASPVLGWLNSTRFITINAP